MAPTRSAARAYEIWQLPGYAPTDHPFRYCVADHRVLGVDISAEHARSQRSCCRRCFVSIQRRVHLGERPIPARRPVAGIDQDIPAVRAKEPLLELEQFVQLITVRLRRTCRCCSRAWACATVRLAYQSKVPSLGETNPRRPGRGFLAFLSCLMRGLHDPLALSSLRRTSFSSASSVRDVPASATYDYEGVSGSKGIQRVWVRVSQPS